MKYSKCAYMYMIICIYTYVSSDLDFVNMDALVDSSGDGPAIHFDITHQYVHFKSESF